MAAMAVAMAVGRRGASTFLISRGMGGKGHWMTIAFIVRGHQKVVQPEQPHDDPIHPNAFPLYYTYMYHCLNS